MIFFSFEVLVVVSYSFLEKNLKQSLNLTDLFFCPLSVQSCLLCAALEVLPLLTFVYVLLQRHQELKT